MEQFSLEFAQLFTSQFKHTQLQKKRKKAFGAKNLKKKTNYFDFFSVSISKYGPKKIKKN